MLKGSNTTKLFPVIISVILHILLILALIYSSIESPTALKATQQIQRPAIQSFLYIKPQKPIKKVASSISKPKQSSQPIKRNNKLEKQHSLATTQTKTVAKQTDKTSTVQVKTQHFSAYGQLSQLRKKLDMQNRNQAFNESTKHRGLSIMHENPEAVPKTLVPLTQDQEKKLNTSRTHMSSITKNDDGTCTIQREKMLGIPVRATTAYFGCGESKYDKNFRRHMKEVTNKLRSNK